MADLALVVPSRERPHNVARLLAAMEGACEADTELIVGIDEDDPTASDYRELDCRILELPGHRGRLVGWLNHLALNCTGEARFVGHIGDDNVPRSVGWDVRIIESLKSQGEIGFCFGDDLDPGRAPGSLSIHIFMTAEVIKRLGYMGPPSIQHMYVDPVWYAWGQATSIEFLPDVVLEHLHYSLGKSSPDESYQRSTGLISTDLLEYHDYCAGQLNKDIKKLGGTPYTPEALAEFNQKLNIP